MNTMNIINEKPTLGNIQRIIVGRSFDQSKIGCYAVIQSSENRLFLCRIWNQTSLRNYHCILDRSVEIFSTSKWADLEVFNSESTNELKRSGITTCKCIEIIPKINNIRALTISLIFKDPWKRIKWLNKEIALIESLKDLLKLFVITGNSEVHLNNFSEFDVLGIHLIKITSIGNVEYGRVTNNTKIKILSKMSLCTFEQFALSKPSNFEIYNDSHQDFKMILNYRQQILKNVENFNESPLFIQQVLLIGPRGCGKSSLLNKVCYDNNVVSTTLDLSEVLCLKHEERISYCSNKLKLAEALSSETVSGLCMIIVKQIESLVSTSGKSLAFFNALLREATQTPNVLFVATTDSPLSLDISLRSSHRFSIEVYLNIPNERKRCSIVSHLFSDLQLSSDSCLDIARNTPGFVLSDLVLIMKRSLRLISENHTEKLTENELVNIIKSYIKSAQPLSTRGAIGLVPYSEEYSIHKIGGLDEIKKKLTCIIMWPILHSTAFQRINVAPPSGVLLYGPPGCAKTSLVRAISSSCNTTFISVSAADLYSPGVGDTEKTVTSLFQRARASAPTILFIDEIDALVGSRSFREKCVQERVLSTFLTELDGVGFKKDSEHSFNEKYRPIIIVVAATNRPHVVDSALLRPGRLDTLIYVPPPDMNQREEILVKLIQDIKVDDLSLLYIAENTENYSGADLVNLCREAGLHAVATDGPEVSFINKSHFEHALKNMKPSLTNEQIAWYEKFTFG